MRPTKPAAALVGLTLAVAPVMVGFATVASAAPVSPSAPYPPPPGSVTVSSNTTTPGGTISFTATGFTPGETVTVRFDNGSIVASFTANSNGVVSGSVSAPDSLGPHTLVLTGTTSGVTDTTTITVVAGTTSSASSLPFTGANVLPLIGVGGALLIGGGAVVVVARRRKSSQTAA